jgi:tetratricopeptide (TPR) repeat protein
MKISAVHVSFALIVLGVACAHDLPRNRHDPNAKLQVLLEEWQSTRQGGDTCVSGGVKYPYVDCGRIQAAIERLALDFPTHPPILLANAVIAFETRQPEKALDYLDAIGHQAGISSDAAVLRSRIATSQGNLSFAERILEENVQREPDHAGLREALASIDYLDGDFEQARRNLRIAERLGAPSWRIAYNRGLIAEAEGHDDAAIAHYRAALSERPGWSLAEARKRGLESERGS